MTTAQVTEFARNLGGSPSAESPNTVRIRFVDLYDLCASGGKEYTLVFDANHVLTSWASKPWTDACRWDT
jgi:hypothetical protein